MGRWHAHASRRAGGRVTAVIDPDREAAARLATRYGAAVAADLGEVDLSGIDVVHVCAPAAHADLAAAVLRAGRHAIVEKPVAADAGGTAAILALARERDLVLCPVHQLVLQPGVRRIAGALPRLGAVLHVDATVCSAGAGDRPDDERDRLAGEILIHPLSLLARLLPNALETIRWRADRSGPGELRATGVDGGASASLLVSMGGRPTLNALRIVAERGTAHADLFHGFAVIEPGGSSRSRAHKLARPFVLSAATLVSATWNLARRAAGREPAFPGLGALVEGVYAAVGGGARPGPIPPGEVLAVARARDAILCS